MSQDSVVEFAKPEGIQDPLTECLRQGARALLQQAVEAELAAFMQAHAGQQDEHGRAAVVRNGYQPERQIVTEIGPVGVQVPKVRSGNGVKRNGVKRETRNGVKSRVDPYINTCINKAS